MKIESNLQQVGLQGPGADRVEQAQPPEKDGQGSISVQKPRERDNLNISATAEKLNQTTSGSQVSSEFRADKVAAIKEQLANNSYQPSSRDVAQKMISSMRNGL
jgi:negative regulator of flagellin synthesis FlgM